MSDPIKHIFKNILDFKESSYIWDALIYLGLSDETTIIYLQPDDITSPYSVESEEDPPFVTQHIIPISDARKIINFITWFKTLSPLSSADTLALTKEDFLSWFHATLKPTETPSIPVLVKETPSFSSLIRINLKDYPVLNEDKQWRQYHRLLLSTASTHNTIQVLTTGYNPTPDSALSHNK